SSWPMAAALLAPTNRAKSSMSAEYAWSVRSRRSARNRWSRSSPAVVPFIAVPTRVRSPAPRQATRGGQRRGTAAPAGDGAPGRDREPAGPADCQHDEADDALLRREAVDGRGDHPGRGRVRGDEQGLGGGRGGGRRRGRDRQAAGLGGGGSGRAGDEHDG